MDSLTTVLNGCLVNSPVPEAFDIPSPSKSRFDVPIRYIKITPARYAPVLTYICPLMVVSAPRAPVSIPLSGMSDYPG